MKYLGLLLLVFIFASCENHAFDRDQRQILAKDEINRKITGSRSITFTGFKEDTLQSWPNSSFLRPIRYTIDFNYKDSIGTVQNKQGIVIFSQQGNALVDCSIIDR